MRGKIVMMLAVLLMGNLYLSAGEDGSGRTKKLKIDQFLKPEKGGIMRGVHFNMSQDEVIEIEEQAVQRRNKRNMLACKLPSTNNALDFSYVTYEFNKKRLKQIMLRSYHTDDRTANKLYYSALNLFDDLYGARYENKHGEPYWQAIDDSSGIKYDIMVSKDMENGRSVVELEYRTVKQ